MEDEPLPLNLCHVHKLPLIINRSHSLLHFLALTFLIYYRASSLFHHYSTPILPHVLVFASELILSFIWLLSQAFRWRPVSRAVFPERLPEDEELPAVDVFICTADPNMEPTVEVMNTVISAMAMDYPPDKLYVYLSDDGGSPVTLRAMREAWRFAKWWLPFCRRYGVKTRCPEAYFSVEEDDYGESSHEFIAEKEKIKKKYEVFTENVMSIKGNESIIVNRDHAPVVEVIDDNSVEAVDLPHAHMPILVYVSREKRPSHPHNFKAGALNVLLRVSGMISNSPYILVLDCDMYCNNPASARHAMCFHLDPKISSSLAFVQFPQRFYNISKNDIYDSQLRYVFKTYWPGFDGLMGPVVSGTCFYIKREALYGTSMDNDIDLMELKHSFGLSNKFIDSLHRNLKANVTNVGDFSTALLQETQLLASCAYENHTKWGTEVGFQYISVLEDYCTGLKLHCKGWTSVYFDPERPSFLGSATTNLNDLLVQSTRWSSGLVAVAISRLSPLIYGSLRMPILEAMCYAELAYCPFYFFPIWCLATIPQLCLLNGIALYPQVSSSYFMVFSFVFLSSNFKHIKEVLSTGGSIQTWRNEQRMWMIKSVTCHFYGSLNAIMEKMGMKDASFLPTNKVVDDEQIKRYRADMFDFQTSTILLAPLCTLAIINMASLIGGVVKVILAGSSNEMFIQIFLSFFIIAINYPIVEGMVLRKDKGRVSPYVTQLSAVFSVIFLALGSLALMY